MLPSNIRFGDNSRVYLRLRKALYGLRSASLAWYKRLSELVGKLGLVAADTEKSVFVGKYEFEGEFFWMLLLAYVDDLMVACKNTKAALDLINQLGESVKIKVTGVLSRDKKIDFLGRRIDGEFASLIFHLDDGLDKPEMQRALPPEAAVRFRSVLRECAL